MVVERKPFKSIHIDTEKRNLLIEWRESANGKPY